MRQVRLELWELDALLAMDGTWLAAVAGKRKKPSTNAPPTEARSGTDVAAVLRGIGTRKVTPKKELRRG